MALTFTGPSLARIAVRLGKGGVQRDDRWETRCSWTPNGRPAAAPSFPGQGAQESPGRYRIHRTIGLDPLGAAGRSAESQDH